MVKKFLTSVADVYAYDENDVLLFSAKTLLDSSIETSVGNTDVRAGRGNQLQYVFYNTAEMNINLTDAQFNLDLLANSVGASIATGSNIYVEETVTLGASGAGTVAGTPLVVQGTNPIYGWLTFEDGTIERVTFTGSNFTSGVGAENDVVCVRYYALDSSARSVTIPSNVVPSIVRLVMVAQLNSSDVATNVIGEVQIIVPKASLTGAFSISMTADGVSSTPLSARALASDELATGACTDEPVYAKIIEIITGANWYDNVIALAIQGGDFTIASGTKQLVLYAVPQTGAPFIPPDADITWASDTPAVVSGLVTYVASGTAVVKASITAKATIDANVVVTAS